MQTASTGFGVRADHSAARSAGPDALSRHGADPTPADDVRAAAFVVRAGSGTAAGQLRVVSPFSVATSKAADKRSKHTNSVTAQHGRVAGNRKVIEVGELLLS